MRDVIAPDGTHITVPVGRIITFGLDRNQNDLIKDSLPAQEYELFDTTEATALIVLSILPPI